MLHPLLGAHLEETTCRVTELVIDHQTKNVRLARGISLT